ncbi:MAG: DUF2382 domain-containing protein [Chitinophagaceae bacterium]
MNTKENNINTLKELGGSDYEIADGQEDIRGWDVKNTGGEKYGEVEELIFNEETRKVRYMVLDLDDNEMDMDDDRKVLIPIGLAELHEDDDDVILHNITVAQLVSLPEYDKEMLNSNTEKNVLNVFMIGGAAMQQDDYYNDENLYRNRPQKGKESSTIPVIKENLEVGKQQVETGGIRIRSRVEEKPVTESVNLREEHVKVERNEVNRPVSDKDNVQFKDTNIEMTEHNEVPVVSKESRVVEEIKLSKDVTHSDETVRDTVRNTEVDIDEINNKNG